MITSERHWPACPETAGGLRFWTGRQGDEMATCSSCGRVSSVEPARTALEVGDDVDLPAKVARRHWLRCARCGADMWLDSPRKRRPLCPGCATPRADGPSVDVPSAW